MVSTDAGSDYWETYALFEGRHARDRGSSGLLAQDADHRRTAAVRLRFTERECLAEERRLLNEHAQGRSTYRQPKVTLTDFAQRFMDDQARPQRPWSPSTVRAYQQVIDNMLPFLGHYTLQELQDVDTVEQGLEAMLVQMRARRHRPTTTAPCSATAAARCCRASSTTPSV